MQDLIFKSMTLCPESFEFFFVEHLVVVFIKLGNNLLPGLWLMPWFILVTAILIAPSAAESEAAVS